MSSTGSSRLEVEMSESGSSVSSASGSDMDVGALRDPARLIFELLVDPHEIHPLLDLYEPLIGWIESDLRLFHAGERVHGPAPLTSGSTVRNSGHSRTRHYEGRKGILVNRCENRDPENQDESVFGDVQHSRSCDDQRLSSHTGNRNGENQPQGTPPFSVVLFLYEEETTTTTTSRVERVRKCLERDPWRLHHSETASRRNLNLNPKSLDYFVISDDLPLWSVRQVHYGKEHIRIVVQTKDDTWPDMVDFYRRILGYDPDFLREDFCLFTVHSQINFDIQFALKKEVVWTSRSSSLLQHQPPQPPPSTPPPATTSTFPPPPQSVRLRFKVADLGALVPLFPNVCQPVSDSCWLTTDHDGNEVVLDTTGHGGSGSGGSCTGSEGSASSATPEVAAERTSSESCASASSSDVSFDSHDSGSNNRQGGSSHGVVVADDELCRLDNRLGRSQGVRDDGSNRTNRSHDVREGGSNRINRSNDVREDGSNRQSRSDGVREGRSNRINRSHDVREGGSNRQSRSDGVREGRSNRLSRSNDVREDGSNGLSRSDDVRDGGNRLSRSNDVREDGSNRISRSNDVREGGSSRLSRSNYVRESESNRLSRSSDVREDGSNRLSRSSDVREDWSNRLSRSDEVREGGNRLSRSGDVREDGSNRISRSDDVGEDVNNRLSRSNDVRESGSNRLSRSIDVREGGNRLSRSNDVREGGSNRLGRSNDVRDGENNSRSRNDDVRDGGNNRRNRSSDSVRDDGGRSDDVRDGGTSSDDVGVGGGGVVGVRRTMVQHTKSTLDTFKRRKSSPSGQRSASSTSVNSNPKGQRRVTFCFDDVPPANSEPSSSSSALTSPPSSNTLSSTSSSLSPVSSMSSSSMSSSRRVTWQSRGVSQQDSPSLPSLAQPPRPSSPESRFNLRFDTCPTAPLSGNNTREEQVGFYV